jgi:hypothetical protein
MPNDDKKPAAGEVPAPAAPPAASSGVREDESLDATNTSAPANPNPPQTDSKKAGLKSRIPIFNNIYLIAFVVIVIIAAAVVFVSLKSAKSNTTTTKFGSLTDQQLSALKGNTTLVGDSKQTLDVQSNSIFEGQVLLRSDLNVAGALKIGGGLSIPSIASGSGTFSQLGVSGGLNVGGDTTLQGQLTVQKNLNVTGSATFGSLNVSSLTITTLGLRGDLNLNQHIVSSGGVPGRSNGTALGSGGTATVSGSDTAGTVQINTGGSPPAGCFVTINFTKSFSGTPHVVISPSNSSAAGLQYYTNRSQGSFSVCTASVPAAGTGYTFDYVVIN